MMHCPSVIPYFFVILLFFFLSHLYLFLFPFLLIFPFLALLPPHRHHFLHSSPSGHRRLPHPPRPFTVTCHQNCRGEQRSHDHFPRRLCLPCHGGENQLMLGLVSWKMEVRWAWGRIHILRKGCGRYQMPMLRRDVSGWRREVDLGLGDWMRQERYSLKINRCRAPLRKKTGRRCGHGWEGDFFFRPHQVEFSPFHIA